MDTSILHVAATLDAPVETVYDILTDSSLHSAFTGGRSDLDAHDGGEFSYFDGRITGTFVELSKPSRIVQELSAEAWPADHYSTVTTQLTPTEGQTLVKVVEEGAPTDELDTVIGGWSHYWASLSRYLAERKKDVVRRFVEEYKNIHNIDIVDELVHEDCRIHIPLPGLPQGREGMRVNGRLVTDAFPDVRVQREFLLVDGNIVMERAVAKATHQGALMGIPPSGNPVGWTELHAYRVEDGMITEVWSEPDLLRILVDIGAVSLPVA